MNSPNWTPAEIDAVRPFVHLTMTAADEMALAEALGRTTTAVRIKARDLRKASPTGLRLWLKTEIARLAPWVTGKQELSADNAVMLGRELGRTPEAIRIKVSDLRAKSGEGYRRWSKVEAERLAPWVNGSVVLSDDDADRLAREFGRSPQAVRLKVSELRQNNKPKIARQKRNAEPAPAPKPSPFIVTRTCLGCREDFTAHRSAARLFCDRCRAA